MIMSGHEHTVGIKDQYLLTGADMKNSDQQTLDQKQTSIFL